MATTTLTTSGLLESQFPEFIVANNPNFVAFVKAYYQWLEDSNTGAVLFQTDNLLSYKDVDETTDQFIQYFINDFLPYFPQEIAADERKLIKAAREFYVTKGSENSLKFLFRVLYNEDAEVFYPKQNILKASDGKWQIPQAVRCILGTGGYPSVNVGPNFDPSNLVQRQGVGSLSNTTCTIESAYATVDPQFGFEVIEIYLSNINGSFVAEENLVVNGTYANTESFSFQQKIIGSLSNIVINPSYQGLNYNGPTYNFDGTINYPGDPVVIFGGLADTPQATKAVAYVNNVSVGSIYSVGTESGGWGYRTFPNTVVTVVSDTGVGANVVVQSVDYINVAANSIFINTDAIEFIANATIEFYANSYTINGISPSGTTTQTVNLNTATFQANTTIDNFYRNYYLQVVSGTGHSASPNVAIIEHYYSSNQIAVLGSPYLGATLDSTSNVVLYADQYYGFANNQIFINGCTGAGNSLSTVNLHSTTFTPSAVNGYYNNSLIEFVAGAGAGSAGLITAYNGSTGVATFIPLPQTPPLSVAPNATTNAVVFYENANTKLGNAFQYTNVQVGKISTMNVINGGYGFKSKPTLSLDSQFETDFSLAYAGFLDPTNVSEHANTVQSIRDIGQIANVQIVTAGIGYDTSKDVIVINNSLGHGAAFSFTTHPNGAISTVSVTNPGEGYTYPISTTTPIYLANSANTQNAASGTGAQLVAYGFDEGAAFDISVTNIGQIYDFRIVSRGFDYQTTPNVSLAIIDLPVAQNISVNGIIGVGNTTTAINLHSVNFTPSTINNYYQNTVLQIVAGTGSGSLPNSAVIRDYNGNTGVANLATALAVAPDSTSNLIMYNANVTFNYPALFEDDFVYQGANAKTATFTAFFDKFGSQYAGLLSNSTIRLYNYTGTLLPGSNLVFSNAAINVSPVPNGTSVLATVYGNGRARANAIFLNGLIQYPGYYLNTDGQLSADQYLQANTEYHNFSYIVQVKEALTEYKNTLLNILHPSGMQVLSYMSIPDNQFSQIDLTANLSTFNILNGSVTSNSYWSNAVLVGASTYFAANAKVGDFVVVGSGLGNREQVKIITNITDNTHLTMESNTMFLGPGYLETINYSASNYTISQFNTTGNAIAVNLNTANFIANTTVDNYYNNGTIKVTSGSGYISDAVGLITGPGNTSSHANLNTLTFTASHVDGYYDGYYLKVVSGTGASASPNTANITAYFGANQIAVLDTNLGATLDYTSDVVIYAPNTATIVGYYSANQIAILNTPLKAPLDSTSDVILTIPSVSNTFSIMPQTENVYGQILVGDGIAFDLGVANTRFNANVVYISESGNALTVDTPINLLTTNVANQSYYIYPQFNGTSYTFINNQ